jgi:A/G-specific adenine glycosylase
MPFFEDGICTETMAEQGLSDQLLRWYDIHARVLPWRAPRGAVPDPYKVWLSEIMLQQTTVAAVKDYFIKFVSRWPTINDLARAETDDVMRAWAGLGYYARARNLHACAKHVAFELGGVFPQTIDALLQLPGVGPYTAGAIAAIAFDQPHAAVDGNVERVLSRLHAIETPLPDSKPEIRNYAEALVPQQRAGDFAQALMDLGATICTPKSPACVLCPWSSTCRGRATGIADTLPRKRPKQAVPTRKGYAYLALRKDGAVLLRLRPDKGLLGGMMEVPGSEWKATLPRSADAPFEAKWRKLSGIVEHTFTHFHLEVTVMKADDVTQHVEPPFKWVSREIVDDEALPSVMRKILAHGLK